MTRIFAFTLLLALTLSFVTLAPVPAHATINADGAARLKGIFTRLLDEQKAATKLQQRSLQTQGDVVVEPAGSYYAVTLPHLSFANKDGSYIDLGILVVNAMPGASDKEWKMTLALPTPIIGYGADKKPLTRLDIGKQAFSGVWNESINNFTKLDARYENITSLASKDGITLKIPKAAIIYDLTPSADGKTWSGPTKFTLENLSVIREIDPGQSRIGRLTMDTQVKNYSYDRMRDYQSRLNALTGSIESGATGDEELGSLFLEMLSHIWDGFGSTIILEDIVLSRPAIPGSPAGRLEMKQARIGFDANGFESDNVTMGLKTEYNGFNLVPAPAGFSEFTPAKLNLDITVEKLPFRKLLNLTRKTVQAASATPTPQENAGKLAAKLIPQMLTESGTFIRANKSFLGNTTYNIDLDGQMNANMAAIMGMDGKAKLEIAGLEKLIALTKEQLKKADLSPDNKQKLQKSLLTMTILQLSGQQGTNAGGTPVRTYTLELTTDGKVMVNGADLSALRALAAAAQPKEAAPAP